MSLRIFLLSVTMLLVFPAGSRAFQGYVQTFGDNATLSWGSGEAEVSRELAPAGEDATVNPLAIRKAVSGARKQLLDIILSVRIDARRTVSAYLSEDAELAARVRGVVQNSPLERPVGAGQGGAVRVSERFRDKLAELVLPTTIQFQSGIPPKLSTSMEQSMGFEGGVPEPVGGNSGGYTGLIIDARGLEVTPALTPVVYGQDGQGVYGTFLVSRDSAVSKGVAAYATTSDPGILAERVGKRPLTVRALSAYGSWRTDLIIPTSMARLVAAVASSPSVAGNCRVVIVVDERRPKVADPVVESTEPGEAPGSE
ncbi:hypothetical protein GM415_14585 [Pseudodesulfovibrio cashew]|uniref:Uncharacterized protein n=1 Tax=Pseudodesulfovibrio cashew TaxID=2678688 RepID=A0A6I6JGK4_9BACT|nr:hypothetical protein [Pseudodesulfovibrio cashew]QGY41301.1 hypothetical protein GM415_14585 [Pseudodesulfovibrio cashew]